MKKLLISLFIGAMSIHLLSSINTTTIQAQSKEVSNSEVDFSEYEELGLALNYVDEDQFELIIPKSLVNQTEIDAVIENQNNPTTRGLWTIISTIGTACWIIEGVAEFDVCGYIMAESRKLLATGRPALKGKYKVTYAYIPGKVPGCEPSHSEPCNSGYYKSTYVRIGNV